MLNRVEPEALVRGEAAQTAAVAQIVADVQQGGERALRAYALKFGDRQPGEPLVVQRSVLQAALEELDPGLRGLLERTAGRIRTFAEAQMAAFGGVVVPVPGGEAGLRYAPVRAAGCYAPGGRYPLPSSVLMTAVTARVAGVEEVWVASPRPTQVTLAAAALAGADAVLAVGGAQAVAAMAYGAGAVPRVDAIVGPGNRWVTAAKRAVSGEVAIDMLAGPSELVVVADASADPALVAADLLAQAEHDADALPVLVSLDRALLDAVDGELDAQLATLSTADVARQALRNSMAVWASGLDQAVVLCDRLAPEHLALHLADSEAAAPHFRHYGAMFVGAGAAEVLGDYGAGPNHVLPTGGTARSFGALSVMSFLRAQTWMRVDEPAELARDAEALAEVEGLAAHAAAARLRM
jgi:histidinol dehydrogenase